MICRVAFVAVFLLSLDNLLTAAEPSALRVVAHRGLLLETPENTLVNFRACLAMRLGLELDVRRTRDGHLIVLHDETVDRTTDGQGRVTDLTLERVRALDAGNWFAPAFRGERVPTLNEVFEMLSQSSADVLVAIDLKADDEQLERDVVQLANRHRVLDRLVMIGRAIETPDVRRRLRQADAKTHVACLAAMERGWDAAIQDRDSDWVYLRFIPSPQQVAAAHTAGKRVIVVGPLMAGWERDNWRQATARGVDAILTDYALELARQLRSESRPATPAVAQPPLATAEEVLRGLRDFYRRTARPDGSFTPGSDPAYPGMSDCAYSDLAAVTYACTIHKTFGWTLPHEEQTVKFLLGRQRDDGTFFNVAGTVDPRSPEGRTYNTTQGLVALRALGAQPRFDPLPVFEDILKADYKSLPAYSTSFFPLAYRCAGRPIPEKADRGIRALMVQDETGYLNDHIAATFHASHYYGLIGEPTPKAREMVARIVRDQKPDGSWMLNMPSRDRHGTYDAVFTLRHEGGDRDDCRAAIERAARWVLTCRNPDGGFGHYPGSTSDADAIYFHVGTLVLSGFLPPVSPLPPQPELLSWGHLMPVKKPNASEPRRLLHGGWIGGVAFSPDSRTLAVGSSDRRTQLWDVASGKPLRTLNGHADYVSAVAFSALGERLFTGGFDHRVRSHLVAQPEKSDVIATHRGAVTSIACSPYSAVASGSLDGTVKLCTLDGKAPRTLTGHTSWVNAVVFAPHGRWLASASSDGTVRIWSALGEPVKTLVASNAEVRSLAVSPDSRWLAAGLRYGTIKVWDTESWSERLSFAGHEGDVWALSFAADSASFASGNGDWNRPGLVKLWDTASGRERRRWQHTGEVLCLTFSPNGEWLAAGGGDKAVWLWPVAK